MEMYAENTLVYLLTLLVVCFNRPAPVTTSSSSLSKSIALGICALHCVMNFQRPRNFSDIVVMNLISFNQIPDIEIGQGMSDLIIGYRRRTGESGVRDDEFNLAMVSGVAIAFQVGVNFAVASGTWCQIPYMP